MPHNSNFKIFVFASCALIMGCVLLFNVFMIDIRDVHWLSGTDFSTYTGMSLVDEKIVATRGRIYDRNGNVLAEDSAAYDIIAILSADRPGYGDTPAYVVDKQRTAESLAAILGCSSDKLLEYLSQDLYQTELGYYGRNINEQTKDAIEALKLPGIEFKQTTIRYYPLSSFASFLIGYATMGDDGHLQGQMGLEEYLNDKLTGTDGYQKYYQDATGIVLPGQQIEYVGAANGNNIYLTLDKTIQQTLEEALSRTTAIEGVSRAWGSVMEVSTGKILGWGSYPTFNQNNMDIKDYLDYCSMVAYEPGSTMKTFTYAAAIDAGVYQNVDYNSNPYYIGYSDGKFKRLSSSSGSIGFINNFKGRGYGIVSLDEAYTRSLNTGIATILSDYLDEKTFEKYLDAFGFFKSVGAEGIDDVAGVKNMTYPYDQISTGYGQASSVTMLQLMQAYSAIMNDGTMVRPYVIDRIVDPATDTVVYQSSTTVVGQPISAQTSRQTIDLMTSVVNSGLSSTGSQYRVNGITVIGKTGTAQCAENGSYSSNLTIHSIMLGMPASDPQVMIYMAYMDHKPYKLLFTDNVNSVENAVVKVMGLSETQPSEPTTDTTTRTAYPDAMPNLANHTLAFVKNRLSDLEIKLIILGDGDMVQGQYPQAGSTLVSGQRIIILTSRSGIKMPDMSGWSRKEVTAFWSMTGIQVTLDGYGYVTTQSIAPNTAVDAGSKLIVTFK